MTLKNASKIFSIPLEWAVAKPETVSHCGDQFLTYGGKRSSLPVEFFSHEFMEVDPWDARAVVDFAAEFGVMVHPGRDEFGYGVREDDTRSYRAYGAIEKSRKARRTFHERRYELGHFFVSLEEMSLAIEAMQYEVRSLFSYLRGDSDYWPGWYVNAASCNGLHVCSDQDEARWMMANPTLTSALSNQIIDFIASETPMKECACEGCGRIFKQYHSTASERMPKTSKNPPRSVYCCKKCRDRQTKRNQRAAAKSRIKH